MKRFTYFVISLFTVCLSLPVGAQVSLGFVGGPYFVNLDLDVVEMGDDLSLDMDGITSFCIGAAADIPLYKNLYLRVESVYLKRGSGLQSDIPFDLPNIGLTYESSYIEVPILLRAEFGNVLRPYILAGPSMGYRLDSHITLEALGIGIRCNVKDITKTVHFGFTYGAGIRYPLGDFSLFVEGRYMIGLSDIIKDGSLSIAVGDERIEESVSGENVQIKTGGLQVMVGITVPLGKR